MKLSLLTLAALIATSAHAVEVQIDCTLEGVFCTSEFQEIAGKSANIESAIASLPTHVKRNWTLKRGNNIDKGAPVGTNGPHGHKVGPESSSATPQQPRAFVWDELTGFTASWNSGNPAHGGFDRIDIYDFDFVNKKHHLKTWLPENGSELKGGDFVDKSGAACTSCHGQAMRPIFPMYPDWPQFYGEFNDEMAGYPRGITPIRLDLGRMGNTFQKVERDFYIPFLRAEGSTNPRYSVLYDAKPARAARNAFYPFRPSNEAVGAFSNVSRAFANRPNLRLGIVYNRLTAMVALEKIKANPLFKKFPDAILYALADCNWDFRSGESQGDREKILGKLLEEAHKNAALADLNLRGVRFSEADLTETERANLEKAGLVVVENGQKVYYRHMPFSEAGYQQIPYEDLLRVLGLDIRDIDIRFKYDSGLKVSRGFSVYDPKAWYNTDSAMDIGYLRSAYAANPKCGFREKGVLKERDCRFNYAGRYTEGMRYFNSYFDGSSTMNELLVAALLQYLTDRSQDFSNEADLDQVRTNLRANIKDPTPYFETLMGKYRRYTDRLALDTPFFNKMDFIGPWVQLPYPPELESIQNRETFWGAGAEERHAQWSTKADRDAKRPRTNANNLCWNIHSSLAKRYLK